MSLFNEIQVGRYNRFVQKLLSMKGPPSMPTVSSDLVFVHPIFAGVELDYLQGWDHFFSANSAVASAGNKSVIEIRNPANSNTIAVLERAIAYNGTAADTMQLLVGFNITFDQPTILNPLRALDSRGRQQSTCILSSSNGGVGTTFGFVYSSIPVATNIIADLLAKTGEEIPILPGSAIAITTPTNAANLNVSILRIRERYLEDSERA